MSNSVVSEAVSEQLGAGEAHAVSTASRFLTTLFAPGDLVLIRPTETWQDAGQKRSKVLFRRIEYLPVYPLALDVRLPALIQLSEECQANLFFGVCPRRGDDGRFDQKWQIRTVRALWADLDDTDVNEALTRCCDKDVPPPSIVVRSGHGVHLYWLLDTPIQIDDGPEPPPVRTEFVEQSDGKKLARKYFVEGDDRVYLNARRDPWPLTPKAQHVEDLLSGIAAAIGGDHTHDLSRLLRLPGPPNRKDQRNGAAPTPTELVECEPSRRYALEEFEAFAGQSPLRLRRERAALMSLKRPRKPTPQREDGLARRVADCSVASLGQRSEVDFAVCCYAIRNGIPKETAWEHVQGVGKFAEAGRAYFDRTWGNAEHELRLELLESVERRAARKSGDGHPSLTSRSGSETADAGTPEIVLDTDEMRVGDEAIAALRRQGRLFQRCGVLVHVVRELERPTAIRRPPNAPQVVEASIPRLRELLSDAAIWLRRSGEEGDECFQAQHVPAWLPQAVAARGEYLGIRPIVAVVESPVLRPDGTILQVAGYDSGTGLLYEPQLEFPRVHEHPTLVEAQGAAQALLDVVRDFPFASLTYRAAWLASVLTPLARHAFLGPAPLFLLDANMAGSGKSMLCDIAAIIATGRPMARTAQPEREDEFRKRVTAIAVAGDSLMLLDNVDRPLGGATLDAVLTAATWKDRLLGDSRMTGDLPLMTVWYASGNNVLLHADTARRTVHIRLESQVEHPEERSDFAEKDLIPWVMANRGRLVTAALTVLRAYIAAERPQSSIPPWGSYEAWSDLIRQAIVWIGLPDPGETRQELRTKSDVQATALRGLLEGLQDFEPLSANALLKRLASEPDHHNQLRDAVCELCPPRGAALPDARSLGNKFRRLRGRIAQGRCLDAGDRNGTAEWFVRTCGPAGGNAASGSSGSSCSTFSLLHAKEENISGKRDGNIAIGAGPERSEEQLEQLEQPERENTFSNAREEIFSWALTLRVDDLPPTPFKLGPHGEVSHADVWLTNVQTLIRGGRNHVQLDDLRRDLHALRQLLSLRN